MPLKIIADSSCNLSKEIIAEKDIEIIPYLISFGDEKYYEDFFELGCQEFYQRIMSENCAPRTSTPPPAAFLNCFEKYASRGYDIIYINMTSAFTSGYGYALSAAKQAMEAYKGINIAVIDSKTCCAMEAFLVLEAVRLSEEGKSFSEIVDTINALTYNVGGAFSLDTLAYALRGGRLGRMGALLGNLLKIKPVILFKDGGLSLYSKARTKKKAMEQTIDVVVEQTKGFLKEKVTFVTLHAEAYEDALEIGGKLTEKTGCQLKRLPEYVCATIGAHSGPGLVGIGFFVSR